jgi:EAL domain-containing protein (putative c-di-GMP-specific phosphodiesterase class I)
VGLVLERFGQGRSALRHLDALPLVQLKLDPALVQGLEAAPGLPVVQTVLELGQRLGMEVLAAGVQSDAQLAQLRRIGFQRFQGWRLAPALAPAAFEDWAAQLAPGMPP